MPTLESALPTPEDQKLADEASRTLLPHLSGKSKNIQIILPPENDLPEETMILPRQVLALLQNLLTQMAKGNAVSLVPMHAELTTKQAADFLGISRPFLVNELLKKKKIKFRKVGTHRRIAFEDLIKYRKERNDTHESAMQELADIAQENNMGY